VLLLALFAGWVACAFAPLSLAAAGRSNVEGTITTRDTSRATLAFISDTQAPIIFETLALKERNNTEATAFLFSAINSMRPATLFILGDVVSLGFHESSWNAIDSYLATLRKNSIPVYGIMGNHDVMFFSKTGEERFLARFPDYVRTGYVRTVDSVAVVLMNSNFNALSANEKKFQQAWYRSALDSLEREPAVRTVIVSCHHSPYSNSTVVGPNPEAQQQFVEGFMATPKCRLFVSGHAHAFEHFRFNGKDFFVVGGGGGLQQPLKQGKEMDFADITASMKKPMFHFLTVRRDTDSLVVVSHGASEDLTAVLDWYRVAVPLH
jgi:UDP-2,3-diacylglucosamine pyrophosphatase LpxH